jgi:hypothetical protein
MSLESDFVARTKLVTGYLRSLKELERNHQTPGRGFYRAAAAITASRAASFIMMYNCIEFGVRSLTIDLRNDIAGCGRQFCDLRSYWREEITRANFHHQLTQGTNHIALLQSVSQFMPGRIDWGVEQSKIPFAGNVDNKRLIEFVKRIDHRWRPPRSTLGGVDLDLIRRRRNELAYGEETFEAIGSNYQTDDLIPMFQRSRAFMVSLIRSIQRYRTQQGYLDS